MGYTWTDGELITATKLNNTGGGYDAVIRLTHTNDSGIDSTANLTPSIISGTFQGLKSKIDGGGFPSILVQYYHPWGYYGELVGYVTYISNNAIYCAAAGYYPFGNGLQVYFYSLPLVWSSNDTITWD